MCHIYIGNKDLKQDLFFFQFFTSDAEYNFLEANTYVYVFQEMIKKSFVMTEHSKEVREEKQINNKKIELLLDKSEYEITPYETPETFYVFSFEFIKIKGH